VTQAYNTSNITKGVFRWAADAAAKAISISEAEAVGITHGAWGMEHRA